MADEADIGNERAEEILEMARKLRKPTGPVPNGRCYNCNDAVNGDARFCDVDCRDDWEKRKELRARQFVDGRVKPVLDEEYAVEDLDDDDANTVETI